ncbi:MAG TPA: CheB methylesterase domain-containing protein [Mycobacteriales bacterium]|nr:CheB methylesterase domain-containing protein [Mycobacteriales bacterium]
MQHPSGTAAVAVVPQQRRRRLGSAGGYAAVVIASSTGGPDALCEILPHWDLQVPVLVVQHMPPDFTKSLAERLDQICPMAVAEARDGEVLQPGRVLIAPGDLHLRVRGTAQHAEVYLTYGQMVNSLRPAADVTFRDAASVWGCDLLAMVLTGMGRDGVEGARAVSAAGGMVLAQDEPSSAIWGMPGEVVEAGLATAVLPLSRFAATVPGLCRAVPLPSEPFEAPEPASESALEIPEQVVRDPMPATPYF